jgi:hypothetical protein
MYFDKNFACSRKWLGNCFEDHVFRRTGLVYRHAFIECWLAFSAAILLPLRCIARVLRSASSARSAIVFQASQPIRPVGCAAAPLAAGIQRWHRKRIRGALSGALKWVRPAPWSFAARSSLPYPISDAHPRVPAESTPSMYRERSRRSSGS